MPEHPIKHAAMNAEKNYFAWFDLPNRFFSDETLLKKKFFAQSRLLHPDFHTQADEVTREEMLEKSVFNTQAYKTLSVFDARVKYILELETILDEENKNTLPPDFLMDMLDFNEEIDQAKLSKNAATITLLKNKLKVLKDAFLESAKPAMNIYDEDNSKTATLNAVRSYYLKNRYILRLEDNLTDVPPNM